MNRKSFTVVCLIAILAGSLSACDSKVKNEVKTSAQTDSVDACLPKDAPKEEPKTHEMADTAEMKAFVRQIYDDILPLYTDETYREVHAFDKYASKALLNLFGEIDAWRNNNNVYFGVMGWDCDPWIMAQDWDHLEAEVLKAEPLSATKGKVDIRIRDGGDERLSTMFVVKENGQWKVDDFAVTGETDYSHSFVGSLRRDFEAGKAYNKKIREEETDTL